jgi:2-polyprenyl-6-methoxyphenol hydroxylase-like FAD-dependent oxidoreductase
MENVMTEDVEVVVVGAGAAGLAATTTLARHGVTTLLVEQRLEPSTLPRATVISTRSMELLRSWGLEEEVLAGGVEADVWLWECPTLARASEGSAHAVGYPTREQAAVVSPCAPGTVPQDWLEAVLRRDVASRPAARLELGTRLVGVDSSPAGVRATVQDRTGAVRTVRSRYLVAADGAHSSIRRALGIEMRDREGALGGVQVVFRAPLWRLLGNLRYALYVVTTETAPGLFLPAGRATAGSTAPPCRRISSKRPISSRRGWPRRSSREPASPSTPRSSASARSTRRASWPIGSAPGGRSSSAMPRTASRRAAAPG